MSLSIRHLEPDSVSAVVTLNGRLLLGAPCQELEHLVADLMGRGVRQITFEIAGITHIDSTGIGRFIDAYSKLRALGGTMHITGAMGAVREMFRVTRLDTVLPVEP
jgi:anti-sigma B factor antagonist